MDTQDFRLGELKVSPQMYAKMVLLNNTLSEDLAKCFGVNGGSHYNWLLYVFVSSYYHEGSSLIGQHSSAANATIMTTILTWRFVCHVVWGWLSR